MPYLCGVKFEKRHIIAFVGVLLFVAYMAGITLFTHSHVVNGVTIVHSHPFSKDAQHQHTTSEYQLLDILCHTTATDSGINPDCVFKSETLLQILYTTVLPTVPATETFGILSLRAPPVCA